MPRPTEPITSAAMLSAIIIRSTLRLSRFDAVAKASTMIEPTISDDLALTSIASAAPQNWVAPTATVTSAISTVHM